ncbi:rhomboid family intramembrane serine protease [Flavimobilis soli]|uniref:rhomboid family intramembrane serine protease n=1 Tax=Flavimobilis soli TaxID=442709 RepID=UPI001FE623C5|nr:rhomboid family intramembrane serine protease [Flavimobilis soli]
MRQQQKAARPERSALGARVRTTKPVATITMIVLCVVSYVLQNVLPFGDWTARWVFTPWIGDVEPYRFLTTAFLHSSSIFHILLNMYALWMVGPILERLLGIGRFLSLYLLTAIAGSVGYLLLASPGSTSWETLVPGASGAIFGLFGAFMVVLRRFDASSAQLYGVIAINFVLGFILPGIAWQAHLGGFVVGAIMGAGYAYAPRERRTAWAFAIPVLTAAVLAAMTIVKYSMV